MRRTLAAVHLDAGRTADGPTDWPWLGEAPFAQHSIA
jgi:hypothetical protein